MPDTDKSLIIDDSILFDSSEYILEECYLTPYRGDKNFKDLEFLMKFIKTKQPKNIIEIGTAVGNTTANICRTLPDAHVFTVCALPEQISGHHITSAFQKKDIGKIYRKYGYDKQITQIYENTLDLDLRKYVKNIKFDLAIIDACHDADYVVNDFYKIVDHLNENAVVLFHDTSPSMEGHLYTSYLGCLRLIKDGYNIEYVPETWYAIWVNNQ